MYFKSGILFIEQDALFIIEYKESNSCSFYKDLDTISIESRPI